MIHEHGCPAQETALATCICSNAFGSAVWWQQDAAFLYGYIRTLNLNALTATEEWVVVNGQQAAAHSAREARRLMGLEP